MRFSVLLSAAALFALTMAAEAKMADPKASVEDCKAAVMVDEVDGFVIGVLNERCDALAKCNADSGTNKNDLKTCLRDAERMAETKLKGKSMSKANTQGKVAVATDADQSSVGLFQEGNSKGYSDADGPQNQ